MINTIIKMILIGVLVLQILGFLAQLAGLYVDHASEQGSINKQAQTEIKNK